MKLADEIKAQADKQTVEIIAGGPGSGRKPGGGSLHAVMQQHGYIAHTTNYTPGTQGYSKNFKDKDGYSTSHTVHVKDNGSWKGSEYKPLGNYFQPAKGHGTESLQEHVQSVHSNYAKHGFLPKK